MKRQKFALPPFRLHSLLEIHIHSFYDAELPSCIQTRFFHETWLVCWRGFGAPKYVIIFVYSDWLAEGKDWRRFFAPFLKLPCRHWTTFPGSPLPSVWHERVILTVKHDKANRNILPRFGWDENQVLHSKDTLTHH